MSGFFRAHRIFAIVVLVSAAIWVGTGHFSSVGSEEAQASQPEAGKGTDTAKPAATEPVLRTVAAIKPIFVDHAREIRVSGATEADKKATLAARASGIVAGLGVVKGEEVVADAIVLALEGSDVTANVTTAEATLQQRKQELEIAEKLFARGNLADLQLTGARAAKAAAEAQLSQATSAVDRLNLRAPFSGIVDSVDVERGEWVQQGTPIATILSLDPIIVRAEVGELDIGDVVPGSKATVRLVSGERLEGIIRDVAREASAQTRTFGVEVSLPNADRKIPSGMTAEVVLFAAPTKAVIVPRSVITLSDKGAIGVRVVGSDNIAQFAPVDLIDDTNDGLVIAGVPQDVRIIVAGQDLVRDGEKVIVSEGATGTEGAQP